MTPRPGITCIVVCYNHGRYVEESLDRVAAQTLRPDQLIVADDASTDDSVARIDAWLARHWPDATFVRHEVNAGLPATLNELVPLAEHELLAIAAADDRMAKERFARQVEVLSNAPPQVGVVYADMDLIDEQGRPKGVRYYEFAPSPVEGDLFADLLVTSVPATPTALIRRQVLLEAGAYDETLLFEDWDMWLRLARNGVEFRFIDEALVEYRHIDGSLSRSDAYRQAFADASIRVLRKHIGVSRATDRIIARRMGTIAREAYKKGRAPAATRRDLCFAVSRHPTPRAVATLLLASAGIDGPSVVRTMSRVRSWR